MRSLLGPASPRGLSSTFNRSTMRLVSLSVLRLSMAFPDSVTRHQTAHMRHYMARSGLTNSVSPPLTVRNGYRPILRLFDFLRVWLSFSPAVPYFSATRARNASKAFCAAWRSSPVAL